MISKTERGKVERMFSKKMRDTRSRQNRCLGQKQMKHYKNRHTGRERKSVYIYSVVFRTCCGNASPL